MLSPASHHLRVPRELHANLAYRRKILEAAAGDRAVQKQLVKMCKEDILFHINTFLWQFNPSKSKLGGAAAIHPFITFPAQEDLLIARPETHRRLRPYDRGVLWCIEHDKTAALEKSRWQGASWLFLAVDDWLCGFHDNVQVLAISRNESAVDDGSKDSLFWKIRYMHENYPDWLMGEIEDSKLYFHYKRTNSETTGQATTKKAGVGGRATTIFVDEAPEIDQLQQVREKTALTADSRFFVGTHQGVGTTFHVMCDAAKSPEIVRMRLHWTDNPEQAAGLYQYDEQNPTKPIILDKDYKFPKGYQFVLNGKPAGGPRPGVRSPWYDRKCVEIGDDRAIAMHLDISPEGSARQFFDALQIRNYITSVCREPVWIGDVDYDPAGRFRGLQKNNNGRFLLWVNPVGDGSTLPRSVYTVGCDIAGGVGSTPSCLAAIDARLGLKVAEYADAWIEERPFARLTVAVCTWLADAEGRGAHLVWDMSGQQGSRFEKEILSLGYLNLYMNDDELAHLKGSPKVRRPGWYAETNQFYNALKDYRQALYDRQLIDRSEPCLQETMLFEYDQKTGRVFHAGEKRTNDPAGAGKSHGDRVTSTFLSWMLAKQYAEGGRRDPAKAGGPQPGSLEWIMALQARDETLIEEYG